MSSSWRGLTNRKAGSQWTWPILSPLPRWQMVWSLECPKQRSPLPLQEPLSLPPQSLLPSRCLRGEFNTDFPWDMYGKTIMHYYRIQHCSLFVVSVAKLEKGSRSSLGPPSSSSSESEPAALSEASVPDAAVLSQSLLAAGPWDERDPPNLKSNKNTCDWANIIHNL